MKKTILVLMLTITALNTYSQTKEERQAILDARKTNNKEVIDSLFDAKTKVYPTEIIDELDNYSFVDITDNTITAVYDLEGASKNEIYTSIYKWVSLNYVSAKNVIQMADKESGTIIVKGKGSVVYPNLIKKAYIKSNLIPYTNTVTTNHTIQFDVKEEKYRVKFTYTDLIENSLMNTRTEIYDESLILFYDSIKLEGVNYDKLDMFKIELESYLKSLWIGKKKRKLIKESVYPTAKTIQENLINEIKLKLFSLNSFINKKNKDDW